MRAGFQDVSGKQPVKPTVLLPVGRVDRAEGERSLQACEHSENLSQDASEDASV